MRTKPFHHSTLTLGLTLLASLPLVGPNPAFAAGDAAPVAAAGQDSRHVVTIEAVVVDAGDKDHFEVSAGDETFVVLTMGQVKVQKGDHLVLKGSFNDNDDFEPDSVDFVDPTGAKDNGPTTSNAPASPNDQHEDEDHVNFPGVITRNLAKDEVEVRGGNGHIYTVELSDRSETFQPGDKVRVDGFGDGTEVRDALLSPADGRPLPPQEQDPETVDDQDAPGQLVDISGHIRRLDRRAGNATLQGDDHQNYEVSGDGLLDFSVRSHIRVRGVLRDGVIHSDRVDLWR